MSFNQTYAQSTSPASCNFPWRNIGNAATLPIFLIFFIVSVSLHAALDNPQSIKSKHIVDESGILSDPTKAYINEQLAALEQQTGSQVFIVTLSSLRGYDSTDYGSQIGNRLGVNQNERDNIVLMILTPSERKMRIEVGSGLENTLTEEISFDILNRIMQPPIDNENYNQSVLDGVDAVIHALNGVYSFDTSPLPLEETYPDRQASSLFDWFEEVGIWSFMGPFLLPILFYAAYILNNKLMRQYATQRAQVMLACVFGIFMGAVLGFVFENVLIGIASAMILAGLAYVARNADGIRVGLSSKRRY